MEETLMALFSWMAQCTIVDQNQYAGQQGVCCKLPDPVPELVCPSGTQCVSRNVCDGGGGTSIKDAQGYDTVSYCSFPSSHIFCIIFYLFAYANDAFFHMLPRNVISYKYYAPGKVVLLS